MESDFILQCTSKYFVIVSGVVFLSNLITMATPTQIDDYALTETKVFIKKAINIVLRVLNIMSLNIGKNKNKDD